ncbi:MAG: hypothetical protein CMP49_01555 [Flavobacteriales bacterium]|nr:hypothetical protein [Flavobacteriales bacterium]
MKNIFLLLCFPVVLFSQVNFSEDISPIIYSNCTECHRVGGAGPMPFTNYAEVASLGSMVKAVTQSGYMPPWHADPDYSSFLGERVLTDQEKQLISDWVDGGMIQGDPSLEAVIPNFPEGSVIGVPDVVLTMEEEYLVEGNNQDDYRVFVFSTNFPEDKYLQSIEIIPGNVTAVHHVLVNIDTLGLCAIEDASTPEYGYECESGFCVGSVPQFAAGYTPGMVPPIWNNDIGMLLPAGADIAIQIHYAPSSIDEYDQTSVNLFFKDQPVEREVEVLTLLDTQLYVPANEVYTHYNSYIIPYDMSIISVLPHMHLIGKSWLVYAENNEDTIPIISIPDWDFNWQTFYQPEYMLKLPEGYTLHAYATYDNTANNFTNPNSPPEDMFWCDYTTCEMFFLPFAYVPYQEGNENIYLGDENNLGCMDSGACNYNPDAIIQAGICDYECIGCMLEYACNYNPNALFEDNTTCEFETCIGCISEEACDYCPECTIPGECDYSCYGCMDSLACNYDAAATVDLGCDYSCIGCTNPTACNYNPDAIIDDNTCGILDDCEICHSPCCYDLETQICDYSVSQEDCTNYWPTIEEVASDLNPYWNDCVLGCTNPSASNYNPDATIDDDSCIPYIYGCTDLTACNYNFEATVDNGSCDYACIGCMDETACDFDSNAIISSDCIDFESCYGCEDSFACNYGGEAITLSDGSCEYPEQYYDCNGNCILDIDGDFICDELDDCIGDYDECGICNGSGPVDYYDCNGECLNDINENNICDEYEQEDCSALSILSIYQNISAQSSQYVINVFNESWDNFFPYPGFILFNSFGDTIAIENINYFGISEQSTHYLEIQEDVLITSSVSLQLFTGFYDYLQCQWDDLLILDNCELFPDPGECDAAIPIYYFDQSLGSCEEYLWGGCNGIVPFWTLEDCEDNCGTVSIQESFLNRSLLQKFDVLGRTISSSKGLIINLYDDGSIEKEIILNR